jgi:hypothetical protein
MAEQGTEPPPTPTCTKCGATDHTDGWHNNKQDKVEDNT